MPAATLHFILYLLSFVAMWYGSGLVVKSVVYLSASLKLPRFIVSFFVLGLLTSLTEMAIGTFAVIEGKPEIFVGNLIGGIVVIFFGLIPLLALAGKGLRVPKNFSLPQLLLTFTVIIAPAFFTLGRTVFPLQGAILIALYILLFFFLSSEQSVLEKVTLSLTKKPKNRGMHAVKMCIGFGLLVAASHQIISSTVFFSDLLHMSPFIVSLIIVSIGTNIPELSLVFRSIFEKKKDIALADYFGSASANTLLFGVFSMMHGEAIYLPDHVWQRFLFILLGLTLFFFFSRSKNIFSRAEALILLSFYICFVILEVLYTK